MPCSIQNDELTILPYILYTADTGISKLQQRKDSLSDSFARILRLINYTETPYIFMTRIISPVFYSLERDYF